MRIALLLLLLPQFLFAQRRVSELPDILRESSGLAHASKSTLYTINDSGNKPILYEINMEGKIVAEINLKDFDVENEDIESLAEDLLYLYVADFGNNMNRRKDLTIYKISKAQLRRGWGKAQEIHFVPAEQKKFPPEPEDLQFDFEGFFATSTELVIFSKNRTEPLDHYTRIYYLSKNPGKQKVAASDSVYLQGKEHFDSWVSGADYNPNKNLIALLSGPTLHMLAKNAEGRWLDFPIWMGVTQKEAVLFGRENTIYCTDEINRLSSGKLYEYDYTRWLQTFNTYKETPAKISKQVSKRQVLTVSIWYLQDLECEVVATAPNGKELDRHHFKSKYYAREFEGDEAILQSKTLLYPVSHWPLGQVKVEVRHPMGTVEQIVNVIP